MYVSLLIPHHTNQLIKTSWNTAQHTDNTWRYVSLKRSLLRVTGVFVHRRHIRYSYNSEATQVNGALTCPQLSEESWRDDG